MKRFFTITVVLFLAVFLTSCIATPEYKSNTVILTYAYVADETGKSNKLAILAETVDEGENYTFNYDVGPTYEEVKNKSTDKPYNNLGINITYANYIGSSTVTTDIGGHVFFTYDSSHVISDIHPIFWECTTLANWTIPGNESLDRPGGSGILLCTPVS